jgi:hypothetical protein
MADKYILPTRADQIAAQNALAARAELARRADVAAFNAGVASRAQLPLLDFVPALSPHLARLDFLKPLAAELERAEREPIVLPSSVAVQHGKTTLLEHFVARYLRRYPARHVIWTSYNDDIALLRSGEIQALARSAGCTLVSDGKKSWRTSEGGGVDARGVGSGIAGLPSDLTIIDDPYGTRADAESAVVRNSIYEWFKSDVWTRRNPMTSVIVNHARWHTDDLIGRLCRELPGWEAARLNIAAVDAKGEPIWKRAGQAELLATARALGEYVWWSLYMGAPRGKGLAGLRWRPHVRAARVAERVRARDRRRPRVCGQDVVELERRDRPRARRLRHHRKVLRPRGSSESRSPRRRSRTA